MQNKENSTKDRELLLSRELNAPIELVWKAWTEPEHISQWWGPNGFTNTITRMDVHPGGQWNLVMHSPDGTDYGNKSVFIEIVKYKKIVYNHISGPKFLATIEFDARGDKTAIKWHMLFESKEELSKVIKTFKADQGLKENIEKLNNYIQAQWHSENRLKLIK
ncbi:MAG: SRPBCC family protein [Flavisolibacter sp.]